MELDRLAVVRQFQVAIGKQCMDFGVEHMVMVQVVGLAREC